jgi:hypothetical protein
MKKIALLLAVLVVTAVFAQDPEDIIVKYDSSYGGTYLASALSSLWPGCAVSYYDGNSWSSFITALQGGDWDMCLVAAMNYRSLYQSDYDALATYYNDNEKLHFFDWGAHYTLDDGLEAAMGVGNPSSMGFTPSHYAWDTGHDIVQGIDPWTLDNHGWSFGVYHHRVPWTTATPVTGWTSSESAGQAGFVEAENGIGVFTGLYASFIGGGQEQALWENVCNFIWGGEPDIDPPYVDGMDPADHDEDVPLDTDIVFHCKDDGSGVDVDTIDFTARDTSLSSGRAVSSGASLSVTYESNRSIAGDLDIDDADLRDVVCTFDPADPLPDDDIITCTVDGVLADRKGNELGDDFVWDFNTGFYAVKDTTWGSIKAEY